MKEKLLLAAILITSQMALAQRFSIKGQVLDTLSSPLPSATILLLNATDSSLVNFGVSDAQGMFELKNVARMEYIFKITFVGYRTFAQKISPPSGSDMVDLGKMKMETVSKELDEVIVQAEKAPVVVKKDTIEYNAEAFKTKPNDNVEGLLKKLPGVEVDNDGGITAQGEQVRRVTVDGKEFFGRDPKLATRNLPADAVDKVQVFDRMSDQAQFTGIDDGQKEKAINLELKEEKRNGAFGSLTAGIGTDDRFQAKANINRFTKGKQLSFLAMGNNTNEQGFSIDEYMNFTGGMQQMMSGRGGAVRLQFNSNNQNGIPLNFGNRANGLMTNYAGGVNFNNEFTKKTEMNGSYFFNYLDHDISQTTYRENFLPTGSFTYNQNSRQNNNNANHRINATIDHKIDSANSLKFTTNFSYNETDSEQRSTSENVTPDNEVQNESDLLNISSGNSITSNSSLLFRHRFKKKGRTISTNLTLGVSQSDREGLSDGIYRHFGNDPSEVIQKQVNGQTIDNLSYGSNVTYTEPLGGRKYLEVNYNFSQNLNDVNREVYDEISGEQVFNLELSNKYKSNYTYHRPGLNFRLNRSKYNLQLGTSLQYTDLSGELELPNESRIERTFQNILPVVRINYDFTTTKHLRFDYETSVQEPSIQQLNPVLDQTDQLNPYQGNPNLRPAYSQSWRLSFNTFDPVRFMSFFSFIDADYTTNAITNAVSYTDFVRTTTPVNVAYSASLNGNATLSFPVNKIKSRFSISANRREQHSINLIDEAENKIRQRTFGGTFRYNYRYKEIFDLSLSANLSDQKTTYEFDQPDQDFLNQTYTAESNLSFLKNYQFTADFNYLVYSSQSTDFSQSIPLLNLSVSRFLLKNKSGELKLSVNNLLDKALGISQTANINYLERQTTNSLGRYFMISFTYAINKHLNPMGMRRGGGMLRIMRQ
jgi:hypothetical protein